ncbi:MAG TPA: cadherin-like domain-containing protein [Acidimicrobiia bacterium]|jgi:hypothetical protein
MRRFFRRAPRGGRRVGAALAVSLLAGLTSLVAAVPSAPPASALSTSGYWLVGSDGGIFNYGSGARFFGSTGAIPLNQPIVGMAPTPDGGGYWMVASDGGIFAFGDAAFYGSMGGKPLNQPIVAMASTRTGKGYWLVASDGGIFSFGDAAFFGSMGATKLNKPIVDITTTPSGRGYWMAASDGGIFSFGDAGFFGSTGAIKLVKRIQAMATTPTGRGYWLVAGDGGVFSFGDAKFFGSAAGSDDKRIVDVAPSASGNGYYMTASNGAVFAFGDAKWLGGAQDQKLTHGIISMAAVNNGDAPIAGPDTINLDEDTAATADVLANDSDPDGGVLTVTDVSQPAHGSATFAINTVGYRPAPNFHGTDSFTYTVADTQGNTAIGTVTVNVRSVDDLPKAVADSFSVPLGAPFTMNVLANDSVGDGPRSLDQGGPLDIVTQPKNGVGTVALSNDHQAIVFTPTKKGPSSFVYRVFDVDGDNSIATVTITVTGPDLLPSAPNVTVPCSAGGCQTDLSKASGFSLGDAGVLTIAAEDASGFAQTADGMFHRSGTTVSFQPAGGSVASASINYQIMDKDAAGNPQPAQGVLTFSYQNGAPTADSGIGQDPAGPGAGGQWQLSAHDPDNDTLTFLLDSVTFDGGPFDNSTSVFTLDPNGVLSFAGGQPAGSWVATFHVVDSHNNPSNQATLSFQTQ